MKKIFILLLCTYALHAKVLVTVEDALTSSFGEGIEVQKKSLMLTKNEAKALMKSAHAKIKSKIFKTYIVKKQSKVIGYGVLLSQKIRSKNGVFLYSISKDGVLQNIEVIAFNEPLEYLPSNEWKKQFEDMPHAKKPALKRDISTITGATLSAKSITDSARIALALYEIKLQGK